MKHSRTRGRLRTAISVTDGLNDRNPTRSIGVRNSTTEAAGSRQKKSATKRSPLVPAYLAKSRPCEADETTNRAQNMAEIKQIEGAKVSLRNALFALYYFIFILLGVQQTVTYIIIVGTCDYYRKLVSLTPPSGREQPFQSFLP